MRYKTVIKIITEANCESEAIDIAGEFLRSELESGVKMTCRTKRYRKAPLLLVTSVSLAAILLCIGITTVSNVRSVPELSTRVRSTSAIQPPLVTDGDREFEASWKAEEINAF